MRRKRFNDFVGTCILPETREALERISDKKLVSLSELTRKYIEEGLARDGVTC
jgi:hypothetical protein